ncbi:MAG: hypothetical protein K2X94_00850 [Amoebophilaceae bacterium]|nr:hypothetical protein [Amoebophilaceae bacterium]
MQNLISQAEFVKLVNGKQGTISKWIKAGKLPNKKGKLIMPEAEKAYRLLQVGISISIYPTATQQPNNSNNPELAQIINNELADEIIIPNGKFFPMKYKGIDIICDNFIDKKSVGIYANDFAAYTKITNDTQSLSIMLADPNELDNFITIELVDNNTNLDKTADFIITKSELLEFLKQKCS